MERSGAGIRLLAVVLDAIVFVTLVVAALTAWGYATGLFGGAVSELPRGAASERALAIPYVILVAAIYNAYYGLEIFLGASLGKLLLRRRICSADGSTAPFASLLCRYCLKHSPTLLGVLGYLLGSHHLGLLSSALNLVGAFGVLMIFGSEKQTWYDRFTDTAVYSKDFPSEDSALPPIGTASLLRRSRPAGRSDPNTTLITRR